MLTISLLALFAACVAMLWNQGMWRIALTWVNVVVAGLLATNYYEPAAACVERKWPSYTYTWDFLMLWLLFGCVYVLLRTVTEFVIARTAEEEEDGKKNVRFWKPIEQTGRLLFAGGVAWTMVSFSLMSLHMAPITLQAFGGHFQETPTSNNFLGTAPDRQWLYLVQVCSRGSLSRGINHLPETSDIKTHYRSSKNDQSLNALVFNSRNDFIQTYHARRAAFQKHKEVHKTIRVPIRAD